MLEQVVSALTSSMRFHTVAASATGKNVTEVAKGSHDLQLIRLT